MPTYDYLCNACKHEFEVFQSITAEHIKKCPECGKRKVTRLFGTGTAVMFKGSGFYETDYRSDSYSKAAEKDAKAAKESTEKKSDKKSESKSETKSNDNKAKKTSKD